MGTASEGEGELLHPLPVAAAKAVQCGSEAVALGAQQTGTFLGTPHSSIPKAPDLHRRPNPEGDVSRTLYWPLLLLGLQREVELRLGQAEPIAGHREDAKEGARAT